MTLGYSAAEMKALYVIAEVHSGKVVAGYNVTSRGTRHKLAAQTLESLRRSGALAVEERLDQERGGPRRWYSLTAAGRATLGMVQS